MAVQKNKRKKKMFILKKINYYCKKKVIKKIKVYLENFFGIFF